MHQGGFASALTPTTKTVVGVAVSAGLSLIEGLIPSAIDGAAITGILLNSVVTVKMDGWKGNLQDCANDYRWLRFVVEWKEMEKQALFKD